MIGDKRRPISWLAAASTKANLASDLTQEELNELGGEVVRSFELDKSNRAAWDELSESAMKLAKQLKEAKSFPWERCSNLKHPLITVSCIQFAARAYPEIIRGDKVVKCHIVGDDPKPPKPVIPATPQGPMQPGQSMPAGQPAPGQLPQPGPSGAGPMPIPPGAVGPPPGPGGPGLPVPLPPQFQLKKNPKRERADRVALHMNYQLTVEMPEWDPDCDRMLHILPVLGQVYKKTYFSGVKNRNISDLILPDDCYINKKATSIENARRITHRLWFYDNDIWEKNKTKLWEEIPDLGVPAEADPNDTDAPHEFLEQHCYKDLDGDGYKEPYVITVHKSTETVVRVCARWQPENLQTVSSNNGQKVGWITPDHYFTHYGFIPSLDGSLNYTGFGQLQEPINEGINSILNQLIDAGTMSNAAGGFLGRGIKMRGGVWKFSPFEWKPVDVMGGSLKDNMVPLPVREPSSVLFQLLGFLVQAGKDISSIQDIITGDAKLASNMPVGTMMALVEQGLKVFTAIYKRIYRSLTEEFMKLYKLNSMHVNPAKLYELAGQPFPENDPSFKPDYSMTDLTVLPVADPNLSSDMQRMLKSQALELMRGKPGVDEVEITRSSVKAIHPENEGDILLTDGQIAGTELVKWKPPPNPQMVKAQANAVLLQARAAEVGIRLQMDIQSFALDMEVRLSEIEKNRAAAILSLAKADSEGSGDRVAEFKAELDNITSAAKMTLELLKMKAASVTGGPGGPAAGPGPKPGPGPGPAGQKPILAALPGRQGGGPVAAGNPTL